MTQYCVIDNASPGTQDLSDGYRFDTALLPPDRRVLPPWQPRSDSVCRVLIDTDTAAEVDDQFVLAYAFLSPERIRVEAITAAPFIAPDRKIDTPDAVDHSWDEIHEVLARLDAAPSVGVFRGARRWMRDAGGPVRNDATDAIIDLAKTASPEDPLYILGIAAPTNVASAMMLAPEIRPNTAVVWLGGQPSDTPSAWEYNLKHDLAASRACSRAAARSP